ncbi:MAG: CHAD domain-containing protein [Methanoregula sp.]|jgi:CHAD domain-containing protein|uniref:CHAD domain-containing protein n=1 Tax=Methanoregula sp. TaxID=2052170 RepID=UPI003C2566D0
MRSQIDIIAAECAGVRAADDPEHIHRMRVASRRLRVVLSLFSSCFPEKDSRHWMHEIKKITGALGAARDTDVQIAFLKKYLKSQATPVPAGISGPVTGSASHAGDPLTTLLRRLQKQRGILQKQMISVLDELEQAQVISSLQAACAVPAATGRRRRERYFGILPVAADRIGRRLWGVHRFEPFVHNPDAVLEHHAMRIAAKKLRYTLETYAPLYRRELKQPIARIKRLQDLLGDIHDCDVWIEQMSFAIIKQRARRHPREALPGAPVSTVAPLQRLLVNRERRRALLYRQFVRYWDTLDRTGFWDDLKSAVLTGQRSVFCHRRHLPAKEEREAFVRLSGTAPDHEAHSRTVAALALRLFDELAPLHGLGRRDRVLLSYAAIVHDIGWIYGQAGHQKKSAELILSCPDLPVPVREQGIVALVAGIHGGNVQVRPRGFFLLLPPADQKRVRILAALLRVTDGLDYLHAGSVTGLHCMIRETDVLCTLTCTGDVTTEKARANKKSDLFADVFGKPLVIA